MKSRKVKFVRKLKHFVRRPSSKSPGAHADQSHIAEGIKVEFHFTQRRHYKDLLQQSKQKRQFFVYFILKRKIQPKRRTFFEQMSPQHRESWSFCIWICVCVCGNTKCQKFYLLGRILHGVLSLFYHISHIIQHPSSMKKKCYIMYAMYINIVGHFLFFSFRGYVTMYYMYVTMSCTRCCHVLVSCQILDAISFTCRICFFFLFEWKEIFELY